MAKLIEDDKSYTNQNSDFKERRWGKQIISVSNMHLMFKMCKQNHPAFYEGAGINVCNLF